MPHLEVEPVPAQAPASCAGCGALLVGPYCAACGQRVRPRLTLRTLARDLAARALDIDGDLWRTLRGTLLRPEVVIEDWVRGRTAPYTSPFTFLGLAFTLVAFVYVHASPTTGSGGHLLLVATPIVLAAVGRLLVRGRTYAEHLVANCYLLAWDFLLFALLLLVPVSLVRLVGFRVFRLVPWLVVAWHARGLARFAGGGWRAWIGGAIPAVLAFLTILGMMTVGYRGILAAIVRLVRGILD